MTLFQRYAGLAFGFFILETVLIFYIDRPLSEMLRTVDVQNHALIDFFRGYTDFGKSKWYLWPSVLGIAVCALVVRREACELHIRQYARKAGNVFLFLFICGVTSGIVADIIKPILGRARPVVLEQNGFYGFHPFTFDARWNSFPSGHATSAFTFAFVLAEFFPRLRIPLFLLSIALALSRIMVNAHFLSDVLAGGMAAYLTVAAFRSAKGNNGIFHISKRIFPIDDVTAMR